MSVWKPFRCENCGAQGVYLGLWMVPDDHEHEGEEWCEDCLTDAGFEYDAELVGDPAEWKGEWS